MDGAMEDLQDMFIVHSIEEIQVKEEHKGHSRGLNRLEIMDTHVHWFYCVACFIKYCIYTAHISRCFKCHVSRFDLVVFKITPFF